MTSSQITRSKSYGQEDLLAPVLPRKGMGSVCTPLEGSCGTGSLAAHPGGIQQRHRKSEENKKKHVGNNANPWHILR